MNKLENEIRATMLEHRPDSVPTFSLPKTRPQVSRATSVIAAACAAVVVAGGTIVIAHTVRSRETSAVQPPAASSAPYSPTPSTSSPPTTATQPSNTEGSDVDLLREMVDGVVVIPGSTPPVDAASAPAGSEWSFTRTRTVSASIGEVLAWYQANVGKIGSQDALSKGRAALYPDNVTPTEVTDAFVYPQVVIVFTEAGSSATRVDVTASGYHRDARASSAYLPADSIDSTSVTWSDIETKKTRTVAVDAATAQALIKYLNEAPVMPVMTYSGTYGGTSYEISFTAKSGDDYHAHWSTQFGAAGVKLDFGGGKSQLLDPEPGFYSLLENLSGR